MSLLITIGLLIGLLLLGSPVVFAVAASGFSYFVFTPGLWDLVGAFPHKVFAGMDSFVFLCIPLFVMAGEIMNRGGLMEELVKFVQVMIGHLRGGMAYVNIMASMLFGGITGSGLADVSALGPLEISAMEEDGYPTSFAAALTATSAIQGPIIPPSIPMVIFASLTNVSIGALFLAGAIPGILLGLSQMGIVFFQARKKNFPKHEIKIPFKEKIRATKMAMSALLMPVIILGGILSGVFTPTEAAAIAVAYAFLVAKFYYKKLSFSDMRKILSTTAKTTASIYLIVGFASVISWVLASERVPSMIQNLVQVYQPSPYLLLFIVNLFFLFNGMWLSDTAQLILFAPLFTPIFVSMGIHPVHFGCVMVVNVMISMITPPYGAALYLASIISKVKLSAIVRDAFPFILASIFVLFLISYFPVFTTFLPKLMGFIN